MLDSRQNYENTKQYYVNIIVDTLDVFFASKQKYKFSILFFSYLKIITFFYTMFYRRQLLKCYSMYSLYAKNIYNNNLVKHI